MKIDLNGVDPKGEDPPDELYHECDCGGDTALVWDGEQSWELVLFDADGERVKEIPYTNGTAALARFASYAHDQQMHEAVVEQ